MRLNWRDAVPCRAQGDPLREEPVDRLARRIGREALQRACCSRSKSACRICRTCSGSMPGLGRTHIVNHDQPFAFSASVFIVAGTNRSGTRPGSSADEVLRRHADHVVRLVAEVI